MPPTPNLRCNDKRAELLLEIYRQTSNHLGRHISGVWQCVGVVGAALIVFAQNKDSALNDYACALVVLLCGWLAATTLDASNWFNRNLTIITNIERLFLMPDDLQLVHYFFERHRPAGKHAQHFIIQLWLSGVVCVLVLMYHFIERVSPGFSLGFSDFEPSRATPYVLMLTGLATLHWLRQHYKKKDEQLKMQSPGITL